MAKLRVALLLGLTVAACGRKGDTGAPTPQTLVAPAGLEQAQPPNEPRQPAARRDGTAFIAYSYNLGFELPARRIDGVQRAHRNACEALGPSRCQLINASRSGGDGDAAEAHLDLRIVPNEVKSFEARLAATTGDAGGTMLANTVTGEDITRELIDADAALKAKRTLRDRLQTLLEHREGRLSDLLAVEKALSETQQQLDTATAELSELQQRVSFSKLSIDYRSTQPLGSTARPLATAVSEAGQTISTSLALLLTVVVAVVPWLVPAGLLLWLAGKLRARRDARRKGSLIPPP
ncbi:DUF4349 domain-containing protein [Polymorphobacter sp. PAMC 29334]|uniref:DUF4349 domain-containing protein n=1 Tax=Polymorphobacter sp. PAMC 29334 TaxID=2862331 RepID=UPI001C66C80C|nr:DUF4349 domain-containing protein [Polymorphobacter sp. PAMC 29334]QYE34997.1 DUF4349 domain-containing protein [Polymorphobacter sp. PAMC 29334]